ncbi:hypothetical protein ANOM_004488 [Aspergillus nomiae NRRL 13137]|uniref:F-box domain-containing protein n=1 Tax=Aspergillus nomiae NRRL (strain ATCC 15546 / NRRL 13137 / CBS 260.88 / M93) TaxID=1509407 RepID=A0A0L1J5V6_ASPN3|nr:uncharacterized protein ANOM_004488 [Aspergillus nomiae NRRL 13137]KNG87045.1 hypothetical protein ANOM_004488 [Aspergillus nomiae NRRL 13137]
MGPDFMFENDFPGDARAVNKIASGSINASHLDSVFCSGLRSESDLKPQSISQGLILPRIVTKRLLDFIPRETHHSLRLTCRSWSRTVDKAMPVSRPAANIVPPEILLQIFFMLAPHDFDNARRTCSQWMKVSLNERLLESMLKRAGWWNSWQRDCLMQRQGLEHHKESTVWKMSRRFATECILSGRKVNVERAGFLITAVVDFSKLSQRQDSTRASSCSFSTNFSVNQNGAVAVSKFCLSDCGNYLLITSRCKIYVYRLLGRNHESPFPPSVPKNADVAPITIITCPAEVMSATIDTSTPRLVVAALFRNRSGLMCDLVPSDAARPSLLQSAGFTSDIIDGSIQPMEITSLNYYQDVGSAEDPPRSVSVCPGRQCVAFGSGSCIELRWIDAKTKQDCRKRLAMSQPSEILHFLPRRSETPTELRLISSLAGPGLPGCKCHNARSGEQRAACPFHILADIQSFAQWSSGETSTLGLVRATHGHHYRTVPIKDGLHFLFIEPRTSLLCIGSDAPFGGPTSLTRALISGSDLNWGLRVVAAYGDRIVLYSVPLDVFNVIQIERERQGDNVMGDSDLARDWFLDSERSRNGRGSLAPNQNGDWDFLLNVSYRPTAMMWPFKIYGKEIGQMDNVVELSLQAAHGGARIWAFAASGQTNIFDIDTFTCSTQQAADIPYKSLCIGADGSVASAEMLQRSYISLSPPLSSRKRKHIETLGDFGEPKSTTYQSHDPTLDGENLSDLQNIHQTTTSNAATKRRISFAARIVDFGIPESADRSVASECTYA